MTYKMESFIEKIKSPIVCIFDGKEAEYADGSALSAKTFDKCWLVDSLSVRDEKVLLVMKENDKINSECGEESFF